MSIPGASHLFFSSQEADGVPLCCIETPEPLFRQRIRITFTKGQSTGHQYSESMLLHLRVAAQRSVVPCHNFRFWDRFLSWSTERGSRQLVFAALGNKENPNELKGSYITSSRVVEPSDYVISDEGDKVQKQLWVRSLRWVYSSLHNLTATQQETLTVLYKVSPGVQSILSSNNLS